MNRVLIAAVTLLSLAGCEHSRHAAGGPYYFESFATYYRDFHPTKEVSSSGAEKLQADGYSFYKVWFNEQGRVDKYEKHYKGVIDFQVTYTYRNGKLVEVHSISPDGKELSQSFSE